MEVLAFASQMKKLDKTAIEELGIPSLDLMEAAAQAVTEQAEELLKDIPNPRAAVFCGPGNNGGDGLAVARLLLQRGVEVRTYLVGDRAKMTPDARAMEEKLKISGGNVKDFTPDDIEEKNWVLRCDLAVDALFGIGLSRIVDGDFKTAIDWMNDSPAPVISCDVPSGVSADTGEILGTAVKAHTTVTFTCAKPGLYLGEGGPCCGKILPVDIGIPAQLVRDRILHTRPQTMVLSESRCMLPQRSATAHKGDFGKVFILAGSEGYTGAPVLASKAAVRSGAGLVFLGVPRSIYPIVAVKCDEAMPYPLPEDYDAILKKAQGCDVALIGPGLGRKPETEELVLKLLRDLTIPVVLDADGLNALSGHIDVLDKRTALTVLTPHDGEFQRLTGCEIPVKDRLNGAKDFAMAHGCVMILKGHNTVTAAQDGTVYLNASGNPGMAKGGCGDVLAGLLAGLLAQKQLRGSRAELCAYAVYYHGQAGDRCARKLGQYGMTPGDMLAELPLVLKEHTAPF